MWRDVVDLVDVDIAVLVAVAIAVAVVDDVVVE